MKLFSLFGSKKDQILEPQIITDEPNTEVQSEETSSKKDEVTDNSMVTITYGTGMPIDIIYNHLRRSYEAEGYHDAFINAESHYREMNVTRLCGLLEIKFNQVRLRYESNIKVIEQKYKMCQENGLFAAMEKLDAEKALYNHHLERLAQMEEDYNAKKPYMTTFITSYENGFLRGIAAIAMGTTIDTTNENKI